MPNTKPVYNTLLKLIKEDWMTKNLSLKTEEAGSRVTGTVAFRGFYGNYEVVVTKPDGSKQTLNIHLKEKGQNQWTFAL